MTAKIIDGNKISEAIRQEVKSQVEELKEKRGITPGLAVVLVGENPASVVYVRNKGRACQEVGMYTETIRLPAEISEAELLSTVAQLNNDLKFHGILVQFPLPRHIDEGKVINAVNPNKDVDCFHPINVGKILVGEPRFLPCTPAGVQQLLIRGGYDPGGKHVVICGRSNIVGKPLLAMLVQKRAGANATVTVCHTGTNDLAYHTRQADILVAAAGSPRVITADMVREGVVIIDVGINRVEDPSTKSGYRLVGDVDFDGVKEKAEAITPVPGGVGPMTIAMLLSNTVKAAAS
ncbi:MAG: bifunctional methylenetetrahydrofolate dehydrogenase/methenyltetrahydrofolate cyclohydrolase FolD [Chloroflexi bacterium]|nr:bifunctional methylenetetrahydrofolate dehydrogenase/methenyltetrahydrofolate cyclohydrolase FolD [Chloroflexota bacterium]